MKLFPATERLSFVSINILEGLIRKKGKLIHLSGDRFLEEVNKEDLNKANY